MIVVYPSSLPTPSSHSVTPAERRTLSDIETGPRQHAIRQRDYLATQRVTWPVLSPEQAATLDRWWRLDLLLGGRWFDAPWPLPTGWEAATRRFLSPPEWRYLNTGYWSVTAELEVRGRTMPPRRQATILLMHFDGDLVDAAQGRRFTVTEGHPTGVVVAAEKFSAVTAKFGSSLSCDPIYPYGMKSTPPDDDIVFVDRSFQVECWINCQDTGFGAGGIFFQIKAFPAPGVYEPIQIELRAVTAAGKTRIQATYETGGILGIQSVAALYAVDDYSVQVDNGTWAHVALVCDAAGLRLYHAGVLIAETAGGRVRNPLGQVFEQQNYFPIAGEAGGARPPGDIYSGWFGGYLDELRVIRDETTYPPGPTITVPVAPFEVF